MISYERSDKSDSIEGSKECMICHYYFSDGFKY